MDPSLPIGIETRARRNCWLFRLEIVTGVSCEARDTCTMQKIMEVIIEYSSSTLIFRILFLGSCPILLYVIPQTIIRRNRLDRTVVQFSRSPPEAGLPSDAVRHCIQELVSLACLVATRQNIAAVQKGALSFWARTFRWRLDFLDGVLQGTRIVFFCEHAFCHSLSSSDHLNIQ